MSFSCDDTFTKVRNSVLRKLQWDKKKGGSIYILLMKKVFW